MEIPNGLTAEQYLKQLQLEIDLLKARPPKEKKDKKVGNQLFVPMGRSGRALVPITGEDVKKHKVKNAQYRADDCRKQADLLLDKSFLIDNDRRALEDELPIDPKQMKMRYLLAVVRVYFEDQEGEEFEAAIDQIEDMLTNQKLWP